MKAEYIAILIIAACLAFALGFMLGEAAHEPEEYGHVTEGH